MKNLSSFFIKLDQLIFSKIDIFKNNYLHIKWVGNSLHLLVLVAPIFMLLFFHLYTVNLNNEIKTKKNIYELSNKIINIDKDLQLNRKFILSNLMIQNSQEFEQRISDIINAAKIKTSNISIQGLKSLTIASNYNQISGNLQFNNISTTDLSQLLMNLYIQQKIKISNINVSKDNNNQLLKGNIFIVHYNEISNNPGE